MGLIATTNTTVSKKVTSDNDSSKKQQYSLPEEANQPGALNIQDEINLLGPSKLKEKKNTQIRIKLPSVISIADRIGILD